MGIHEIEIIHMIKRLIFGKSENLLIQLIRYIVSGAIAFGVDFTVLWILTDFFDFYYLTSSVISFMFGLAASYLTSATWVFDEKRLSNKTIEITIFGIIGGIGLLLTSFFMWLFTSVLFIYYLYSKILTTAIVFIWNFIAKKKILFTKKMN